MIDHIIELLGFIVGLIYLYFEYKADRRVWLMSVIMPAISLWVYFRAGLYADFGINIYYLVVAAYGYAVWAGLLHRKSASKHEKNAEQPITHITWRMFALVMGVFGVIYLALIWVLITFTDSNVPFYDAFNTALSIVGMWMLARKYIEQWIVWMVVDVVCVGLDIYKGIYLYALLYLCYTVIAVAGYRNWKKLMRQDGV